MIGVEGLLMLTCRFQKLHNFMVIEMDQKSKQVKKSAVKAQPKSLLEDWQSFRAWQEALYNSCGKRVPVF